MLARLVAYDFPGNMRELKNTIEHAIILCTGDELRVDDLPRALLVDAALSGKAARGKQAAPRAPTLREARETWLAPLERQYLIDLLAAHAGNVKRAARAAGIDAVTLYRLLRRRGLSQFERTRAAQSRLTELGPKSLRPETTTRHEVHPRRYPKKLRFKYPGLTAVWKNRHARARQPVGG